MSSPMTASATGHRSYELACTDCSFSATFEGDIDGLFDRIESHQAEMELDPGDHFVEFEAVPSS